MTITFFGLFYSNKVQGFSINTSNFVTTDKCIRYGDKLPNILIVVM